MMWWIYALFSAFFAALTALFAKAGIKGVNPDLATAIRTAVILLLTWGIVLFRGGIAQLGQLQKTHWFFLVISGLATGLSWLFYFKALQVGEVSKVAPVDKLSVALAVILAAVFLKEPITLKNAIGALLIIGGSVVMIL